MSGILTQSGVSAATGEPFVAIIWDGPELRGQLTVAEARELGLTILTAAEAAVTDAALMAWLRITMGIPIEQAAAAMSDYRVHRAHLEDGNDA